MFTKMRYYVFVPPPETNRQEGQDTAQPPDNVLSGKNTSKFYIIGFVVLIVVGIAYAQYKSSLNKNGSLIGSPEDSVLDNANSAETSTNLENLAEMKAVDESIIEVARNDDGNAIKGETSGVNVSEWFVKNEKGIYLVTPPDSDGGPSISLVSSIDSDSFIHIGDDFYKDKNAVYYLSTREGLTLVLQKFVGVDPGTFTAFTQRWPSSSFFFRDKSGVYLYDGLRKFVFLPDINPETFQILNPVYSRDKNGTYAINTVYYARDNSGTRSVKTIPYKMLDIDNATFELIQAQGSYLEDRLAKDSRSIYYAGAKIPMADPSAFQILNEFFVADKSNVYAVIPHSSDSGGGRDGGLGYDRIVLLEGVEAKNFKLLHNSYATDGSHVFTMYSAEVVRGADPATFEPYKEGQWAADARDARHIYSYGKMVLPLSSIPADRLKIWGGNKPLSGDGSRNDPPTDYYYVTDGLYVYFSYNQCEKEYPNKDVRNYCLVELVEGADPVTFQRVEGTYNWKDKNGTYFEGVKTQ